MTDPRIARILKLTTHDGREDITATIHANNEVNPVQITQGTDQFHASWTEWDLVAGWVEACRPEPDKDDVVDAEIRCGFSRKLPQFLEPLVCALPAGHYSIANAEAVLGNHVTDAGRVFDNTEGRPVDG